MELDFMLGSRSNAVEREPDAPLRVLVMGNFSGSGSALEFALRKPLRIDIDNFEKILGKLNPAIRIRLGDADSVLTITSMDDFHPDNILRRVAGFADIERIAVMPDNAEDTSNVPSPATGAESDDSTLTRLLGSAPGAGEPAALRSGVNLDALIRTAVAPHLVAPLDPNVARQTQSVDVARTIAMRELLHDSMFQELEAAWRGLRWLVFEHDAGEALEISILDVDRSSLHADLERHSNDLRQSHLYNLVVTEAHGHFGGHSYASLIGDYVFGPQPADMRLLAALGAIAMHAGAPFIAGAEPSLIGGGDLSGATEPTQWPAPSGEAALLWQALRECPQAPAIGLVLPRLIGRLPDGGRGEEIESFTFDELIAPHAHDNYLWLNGAFGCAQLITAAFARSAWQMEPGDVLDLEDLPAALYESDEGPVLKACAEMHLSHASAAHLLELGVMPLMSHRDRNVARLARFQSIASPPTALRGPWDK
jgi:type VI secretion system protein ImpC